MGDWPPSEGEATDLAQLPEAQHGGAVVQNWCLGRGIQVIDQDLKSAVGTDDAVRRGQEGKTQELVRPLVTNFFGYMSIGHDMMPRSRVDDEVRVVELRLQIDRGCY